MAGMQLTNWVSILSFLNLLPDIYARNGLLKYHPTNIIMWQWRQKYRQVVSTHITLKGFEREHWTMRYHFDLSFGTFAKKALLLQAPVPADVLRTCRVDNITTLRTGKEEASNEIYFQQENGCNANSLSSVLLQIQERSSQFLRKYRLVHRAWQEDITCGDCIQDRDSHKCQG